jgi:hypothetical protein
MIHEIPFIDIFQVEELMDTCSHYRECQYSLVNLIIDPVPDWDPVFFYCRGDLGHCCLRSRDRERREENRPSCTCVPFPEGMPGIH